MSESTLATIVIAFITAASAIVVALIQNRKEKTEQPTGIHLIKPLPPKKQLSLLVIFLFAIAASLLSFVGGLLSANLPKFTNSTRTNELLIESIPSEIFNFGGRKEDSDFGITTCNYTTIRFDDQRVGYRLAYTLPNEGDGSCGVQFEFEPPQDLRDYSSLEFTVEFTNLVNIAINIRDSNRQWNEFVFNPNDQNAGATITSDGNKWKIKVSLKENYKELTTKFAKTLSFAVFTNITERSSNTITISDIKFTK